MTNISVCELKASSGSAIHDEVSITLLFVLYHIVTDSIYCREREWCATLKKDLEYLLLLS